MPSKRKSTGSRTLGAELRRRRGERTLQQISEMSKSSPFADRVDPIGVSTLYMIEEGQTMPTLRSLHTLATLYRVPVQHLFTLLSLERYRKSLPDTNDVAELRETALEALTAADYEVTYAASQRWEELAPDERSRRAATNNKASALWKLGHLEEASLLLLDLLADPKLPTRQAVVAFTNLAEVFRGKGNLRQALVQAEAGLAIARDEQMDRALAYLLRTRANILGDEVLWRRNGGGAALEQADAGRIARALEDYEASSAIFGELNFATEVLFNDVSCGQALCLLSEHPRGQRVLEQTLESFRNQRHEYGEAAALTELGRAHFDRREDEKAKKLFWEAERIANSGSHADLAFVDYYYLMRIEERSEGNPSFFFKKCQRLHPVIEARTPEVAAFESLSIAGGGAR
jgi:tetratricopeptide (TPR) repeat protein